MKRILLSIFFAVVIFSTAFSQIPASFNYQAVVRNSSGEILANKTVSFRISLLQGSKTGAVVYSEKHKITTNDFGLVNLKIGKGTKLSGTFAPAGWGDVIFTKVEIDPEGGSSFSELATSELSSVPFAFKAQTTVNDKVDDADHDPTNEIQKLKLTGTLLELSDGGGSVTLPTSGSGGGDNWGAQVVKTDATLTGDGTSGNPLSVIGDLTDDQTLSLSGNDLSIDGGNTVTLPTAGNTSGWTDDGSVVKLITSADIVSIGVTSPSTLYKLQAKVNIDVGGKAALFGLASANTNPSHYGYGVYGILESDAGGAGVFGEAKGTTNGAGVYGKTDDMNGYGVFGENTGNGFAGYFLGNGYFSHKVGIGTVAPSAALDVIGNAHISGKITSGTANVSLPIAYGVINTGGSVNNATNNVSCTWVTDHYEISISGESYSQTAYVCSVEALGITPVMTTTGANGGKLQVYIYNTLGTKIKDAFHFVIYKL